MKVLLINPNEEHGNRFLISAFVGLYNLGHNVTWLGTKFGAFDMVNPNIENNTVEHISSEYSNAEFISEYSKDEAALQVPEADLILFHITHSSYGELKLNNWIEILNKYKPYDFLLYDSRDALKRVWGQDETSDFKYKHYLKREAYRHFNDVVYWVGMSTHDTWNKDVEQDIDILCPYCNVNDYATYNKSIRHETAVSMYKKQNIPESTRIGILQHPVSFDEYITMLNQSRIAISIPGAGYICYRDYEILSTRKTILAIKNSPIDHLPNHKDMVSCIRFNELNELQMKLTKVLNDDNLYQSILDNQNEVTEYNETPEAKAVRLIEIYDKE